jgi:large subunit ribosomal protein L21
MYAVILTGGKQYRVSEGDVIEVEKLDANVNDTVELDVIMTVDGETVVTGNDVTAKAKAIVLAQGKDKKITVFKYKAKKSIRKKQGHRQPFTRIKIETIA